MTRPFTVLALTGLIAACGSPGDAPAGDIAAPSPTATGEDYVARVRALPDTQRNGVLFRAIRDAGEACQQVTASAERDAGGPATWTATCEDGRRWIVAIESDGDARVAGPVAR